MKECSMLISSIVYPPLRCHASGKGEFYNYICIKLISISPEKNMENNIVFKV